MRSPLLSQTLDWNLAELYLSLGRFNQSLHIAYSLVKQDASQSDRYLRHQQRVMRSGAAFAEEVGDANRAVYYWDQVTQQQPQDASAWHGLGLAKANLNDFRGAQVALTRSLQISPNNGKVRSQLLEIETLLGTST
jgi:Flp pilus assembly protein TadD